MLEFPANGQILSFPCVICGVLTCHPVPDRSPSTSVDALHLPCSLQDNSPVLVPTRWWYRLRGPFLTDCEYASKHNRELGQRQSLTAVLRLGTFGVLPPAKTISRCDRPNSCRARCGQTAQFAAFSTAARVALEEDADGRRVALVTSGRF